MRLLVFRACTNLLPAVFTDKQWREFLIQESFVPPPVGYSNVDYNLKIGPLPVFMYTNNILENCTIPLVEMYFSIGGMSVGESFDTDPYNLFKEPGPRLKVSVHDEPRFTQAADCRPTNRADKVSVMSACCPVSS